MAFSFFGGVHPKENKFYACDKEIEIYPAPDVVVIPMSQHIGAPCKPLVKKGDLVTVGQKIGDNQGLCVPVHASVSGKVKSVEMKAHTSGTNVMSVVIENDHLSTLCEDIKPRTQEEVDALSNEDLINIIREGGIVGGHGGMDGLVYGAFADCLINGWDMPIDVYDAAAWMAITPLSEASVKLGGAPVEIPDFTDGTWFAREERFSGEYTL